MFQIIGCSFKKLHPYGCPRGEELGDWVKKVKGLNKMLRNSHGDINYSIRNIGNNIVITLYGIGGTRKIEGTLCKVLYCTPETKIQNNIDCKL